MKQPDDPNASATIVFGIVGAILVFVVIVALQALFYWEQGREFRRKVVGQAPSERSRLTAEQQERIGSYRWLDANNGIVAVPIERAMELVAAEMRIARAAATRPSRAPSSPQGRSEKPIDTGSAEPRK